MTENKEYKTYRELREANWSKLFNQGTVFDAIRWLYRRKKQNFSEMCNDEDLLNECLKIIQLEALNIQEKLVEIIEILDQKNSLYMVKK